ncbi:hypothetical protein RFI_04460, partial [Reticulomyxa filosa]
KKNEKKKNEIIKKKKNMYKEKKSQCNDLFCHCECFDINLIVEKYVGVLDTMKNSKRNPNDSEVQVLLSTYYVIYFYTRTMTIYRAAKELFDKAALGHIRLCYQLFWQYKQCVPKKKVFGYVVRVWVKCGNGIGIQVRRQLSTRCIVEQFEQQIFHNRSNNGGEYYDFQLDRPKGKESLRIMLKQKSSETAHIVWILLFFGKCLDSECVCQQLSELAVKYKMTDYERIASLVMLPLSYYMDFVCSFQKKQKMKKRMCLNLLLIVLEETVNPTKKKNKQSNILSNCQSLKNSHQ